MDTEEKTIKNTYSSIAGKFLREFLFEILCILLIVVSLVLLWYAVEHLGRRDYPGSLLLTGAGLSIAHLGGLMARLALADRS